MKQFPSLPTIAYILRSYPRLSQTFVLNEIWALEQLGLPIQIFAMTDPHEPLVQSLVGQIRATVNYLELPRGMARLQLARSHFSSLRRRPKQYLRTLWYVIRHDECDEGYTTASRFTCFHLAVFLAEKLEQDASMTGTIQHIHAHFAHDPTLIAQLVHDLLGLPFTFTAHARDLYQIPQLALADRVAAARTVITCCEANLDYLHRVTPQSTWPKIQLIRHGVNLQQFQPRQPAREHEYTSAVPLILSVGRLVEKKGFPDLLHALAQVKAKGHKFGCHIYGEGPLQTVLCQLIAELGLTAEVQLMGSCKQHELIAIMQQSDLFVLTPCVTDDGDRDGIPNVIAEAMACGLPVVSTAVGGIPELIVHHENGLLCDAHDVDAIASHISTALQSSALRSQYGLAARQTVEQCFDLQGAARKLIAIFTGQPSFPEPA